ncbi:uncharacterized protein LOC118408346 [Branchiostoma floridae]|uniref:Uncharacterized protein LOC118408346 n=1 Tax=Branchiostoma floridae TaxID=7739 RepID=A0A9J7HVK5_BRAFL|nr:uncharacterized protein LOC118408346 [Branchiostoma floridae]
MPKAEMRRAVSTVIFLFLVEWFAVPCETTWQYEPSCYRAELTSNQWRQALTTCRAKGGYLATGDQVGELDSLKSLIPHSTQYWLGARKLDTLDRFYWIESVSIANPTCITDANRKIDCGFGSQWECESRGCCYQPAAAGSVEPWCSYKNDIVIKAEIPGLTSLINEDCVILTSSGFYGVSCDGSRGIICESEKMCINPIDSNIQLSCGEVVQLSCPPGFQLSGDSVLMCTGGGNQWKLHRRNIDECATLPCGSDGDCVDGVNLLHLQVSAG